MVGNALARIVWSAAAKNIATMTPGKICRNASRTVSCGSEAAATSIADTVSIA